MDTAVEQMPIHGPVEIRNLRIEMGLNQELFGVLHGVGHSTIAKWENAQSVPTKMHNFRLIMALKLWQVQHRKFVAAVDRLRSIKFKGDQELCDRLKQHGLERIADQIRHWYFQRLNTAKP